MARTEEFLFRESQRKLAKMSWWIVLISIAARALRVLRRDETKA